jgi:hypothetical protein
MLQAFFGLGIWMPLGVVALVMLISGPSMLIAWLKLRHRNLGPLLDANGWAINGRVRINVPFGEALTGVAALPPGSARSFNDPYAVRKIPWPAIVVVLAILAWSAFCLNEAGLLHRWFGFGKLPKAERESAGGARAAEDSYRSPLMEGKGKP